MSSPDTRPVAGGSGDSHRAPTMRASQLLRVPTIWFFPLGVASVLIFLIALFYIGSVVNPVSHLSGLPVALADEDQGASVLGRHVDIGAQVASSLRHSHAVSSRLSLDAVPLGAAEQQMRGNDAYTTIVIPPGFTASLLGAYGLAPARSSGGKPTVRLLTNPRSGSIGVALATGVAQPAAFGTLGQLIALLVFIYLASALSGGTTHSWPWRRPPLHRQLRAAPPGPRRRPGHPILRGRGTPVSRVAWS